MRFVIRTLSLKDVISVMRWLREIHQIYGSFFHILQIYPKAGDLRLLPSPTSLFHSQMGLLGTVIYLSKSRSREVSCLSPL